VSVVAARYLGEETNPWLALVGLGGVALALGLHASASRAYRDADDIQRHSRGRHLALASFVIALGVLGLAWVLFAH
jgi:O-antigen/teichoic acid export membrane protein